VAYLRLPWISVSEAEELHCIDFAHRTVASPSLSACGRFSAKILRNALLRVAKWLQRHSAKGRYSTLGDSASRGLLHNKFMEGSSCGLTSLPFFFGRRSLQPVNRSSNNALSSFIRVHIVFSSLFACAANMTLTNGDSSGCPVPLLRGKPPLDYTKALEVLENEYPEKDGLDIYTLLNSTKNGALTYNDFLVLPGYIGMRSVLSSLALC
jgi:hypothetical protein